MKDIGNVKNKYGKFFKVFWSQNSKRIEFSHHPDDKTYLAPSAKNEINALKNAKKEADKIEDPS